MIDIWFLLSTGEFINRGEKISTAAAKTVAINKTVKTYAVASMLIKC